MANVNNLFGFRPINRESGGPFTSREYGKPATDTVAIYMNDLVLKAALSVASPTGLGNPVPGCKSAQTATPATSLYQGVSINYGAASTLTTHLVIDASDVNFIAQVDGSLAVTTASHVGKNANAAVGAGSVTTKQSGMGVANGSIATTAGLDLRIIRVSNISPNVEGANAIVEVTILKSEWAQGTAGI